ncbi:C4orf29 family protein [Megaselia abdita]
MASIAATNWPKPLVLVPCLSWSTASAVFTTGVMSQSINWDMLETQYFSDGNFCEKLSKMVAVVDDAFVAGQHFIRNFNESMKELESDITNTKENINVSDTVSYFPISNKKMIRLDKDNHLQLSENLHNKLMSEEKFELNNNEVKELNDKIKDVQEKVIQENKLRRFLRKPTAISTSTIITDLRPQEKDTLNKSCSKNLWNLTKLMKYLLPSTYSSSSKLESIDTTKTNWWEREALQFMRGVMDECTHLKNFSVPYDTNLAIAVCAKDDAYVPRKGCSSLEDIWPGVEVRYLDAGHVSAYVLHQKLFR